MKGRPLLNVLITCLISSSLLAEKIPPNIVLIMADDVGIEPLGCYGGTSFDTPRIDQLAAAGLRFTHCYSMPVCHPTRICLLTGRYPRLIGNPSWGTFPAALEAHTLANVMRRAGYATAVAGKWQLALLGEDLDHPRRLGFDHYCLFGWHEGPRYHDPLIWQDGQRLADTQGRYGPDLYVDFLVEFFRRHREQPFFAFYSMALCHDVTDDLKQPVPYAAGQPRYMSYGEMVRSMDHCVGRISDALDALGLRDNTWLVFTSDNGTARRSIVRAELRDAADEKGRTHDFVRQPVICEIDGQRRLGGKGTLHDAGTRVPLIVSRPGALRPGSVDDLVDFSDFLPTLAELGSAMQYVPAATNGVSFASRLLKNQAGARRWAYSESKGDRFWVRTQRYKLTSDGDWIDMQDNYEEVPSSPAQLTGEVRKKFEMLDEALRALQSSTASR